MEKNKPEELKEKLVKEEITLDEYNRLAEELMQKSEEESREMHQEHRPAHEKKNKQWLYLIISALAVLVIASFLTNDFGLRQGSAMTGNASIKYQGAAAGNIADPSIGPEDAKITIIEYSDFECPFCQRAEITVKQVLEEYKGRVRLVYKNYPLSFHNNAKNAAEAAECANEQGRFWEYHGKLFENRLELGKNSLKKYAEELGMDMEEFNSCFESGKYKAEVESDMEEGDKLGIDGVPVFFINSEPLVGAQPLEAFKAVIDRKLSDDK